MSIISITVVSRRCAGQLILFDLQQEDALLYNCTFFALKRDILETS